MGGGGVVGVGVSVGVGVLVGTGVEVGVGPGAPQENWMDGEKLEKLEQFVHVAYAHCA